MSQSKKRKNDHRKRPGAQVSGNPQVRRSVSSKGRLGPFFKLLGEIAVAAEQAVQSTPNAADQLVRFDIEILMRGANSVKAVRTLLEQGHWEPAVGVTRQLFELLVNMEYLGAMEDRAEGTLLFARFGLLQVLLAQQRKASYQQEKGHSFDAQLDAMVDQHLANDFSDFQGKPKADGSVRWVSSWCRKDTAELAKLSSDPMRAHQYNILFRVWSEQAHAAPGALIADMFRGSEEGWVEQAVIENDQSSVEAVLFTVMFFLRLWLELPNVPASPERVAGWLRELSALSGGPALPPRPWTAEEVSA
ncbi:DUF5677 domain-containing protein [Streptomyces sp. NPDC050211]|uniref:DUF5677 domain-containing protein n=1 Tax=Streptomyces sp. NPDC050211 TaxID=3154932 RepID=UPI00341F8EE5